MGVGARDAREGVGEVREVRDELCDGSGGRLDGRGRARGEVEGAVWRGGRRAEGRRDGALRYHVAEGAVGRGSVAVLRGDKRDDVGDFGEIGDEFVDGRRLRVGRRH